MRCVNSLDISLDSYLEYQQPVAVLPHASGYYKFGRFVADMCSRDVILELRSVRWELSAQVRSTHLLWSRLAVAVPAAVVGQVNTSRLDVTASPTAKPATGKSQSCQQPVVVVATRSWRAVSVIVIDEKSFCLTRLRFDNHYLCHIWFDLITCNHDVINIQHAHCGL